MLIAFQLMSLYGVPEDLSPKVCSLETIVEDLNLEHSRAQRDEIFASVSKTVCFQIRSRYDLWNVEKSAERQYFEEKGIKHPDYISSCIYEAWKESHENGKFDADAIIAKYAKIYSDWEKWQQEEAKKWEDRVKKDPSLLEVDPFAPQIQDAGD